MGVVTLLKWAFTFGSILFLFGCADPIDGAKKTLESGLLNNLEVAYRNTQSFPGGVVCGEVNAFDRWGSGPGYKRFIVRADRASTSPSDDDWVIFCSEDSSAALHSRLGIGPLDKTNPDLLTVQKHLNDLDQALQRYLADNQTFPPTEPGLQSLVSSHSADTASDAKNYMDSIPEDPWGRPYHYEKQRQLYGAIKKYKLFTLGRDGIKGGGGEDADISNEHLKYLNHIANL